jgi:hypothetical protein
MITNCQSYEKTENSIKNILWTFCKDHGIISTGRKNKACRRFVYGVPLLTDARIRIPQEVKSMSKHKRSFLIPLLAALVLLAFPALAEQSPHPVDPSVAILFTNDIHS